MSDKQFTYCGTSTCAGTYKVRWATDAARVKVLEKTGHTDIKLVELPAAMIKLEAAQFIQALPEFDDPNSQTAISTYLETMQARNAPKVPKKRGRKPSAKVVSNDTVAGAAGEPEAGTEGMAEGEYTLGTDGNAVPASADIDTPVTTKSKSKSKSKKKTAEPA